MPAGGLQVMQTIFQCPVPLVEKATITLRLLIAEPRFWSVMTMDHPARRENPYGTGGRPFTGFDGERHRPQDLRINIREALRKIA